MAAASDDLVSKYYARDNADDDQCFRPGALFWGPVIEFEDEPWFAIVDRVDPEHMRPASFMIRKRPKGLDPFDHLPIKEANLELQSNEALVVFKAKKRPVILFSSAPEQWNLRSGRSADQVFLCLPAYSLEGYDQTHLDAVHCFKYARLFYLPHDPEFARREAMLRFDRSQMILRSQLERMSPRQRLTDDALTLLRGWFRYWSLGAAEDWILQYQEQQLIRFAEHRR